MTRRGAILALTIEAAIGTVLAVAITRLKKAVWHG